MRGPLENMRKHTLPSDGFPLKPREQNTKTQQAEGSCAIVWMHDIHFAPPKKPWNDESPVNTNKQWIQPWFASGAGFRPSTAVWVSSSSSQETLWAPLFDRRLLLSATASGSAPLTGGCFTGTAAECG